MEHSYDCDVVVVGGGIAGLVAATTLEDTGASVIVAEARSQVGGRTRSRQMDGAIADLGGQFVGRQHTRLRQLIDELDLTLVSTGVSSGDILWRINGTEQMIWPPGLTSGGVVAFVKAGWALHRLAKRIDPYEPWRSPRAASLDEQSLAAWLDDQELHGSARVALESALCGFATVSPQQLSLLHVLWWIRRAGGVLAAVRSGSDYRIMEGAQAICLRLAEKLHSPILRETPVASVRAEMNAVQVVCTDGTEIQAQRAIIAVPPPALQQLTFTPSLNGAQRALVDDLQFGQAAKIVAIPSATPDGRHQAAVGGAPISIAWRTDEDCLVGITYGEHADAAEQALVTDLADIFRLSSRDIEAHHVIDWTQERFTGSGSYVAFAPGQLSRHGPHLNQPHGPIRFAGAERSSWPNSMEGAVESGSRTANRVRAELDGIGR